MSEAIKTGRAALDLNAAEVRAADRAARAWEAGECGPIVLGSEAHKRAFCRMLLDTHNPYRPSIVDWPALDPEARDRLVSLPIWDIAMQTEGNASLRMLSYANIVADPLLREAIEIDGFEEKRHKQVLTNLVAAYEDLSEPIRDLIDHLQAVHQWHGFTGETREGYDRNQPPPAAVHPVVRVHPVTQERALFVNPGFTRYIVGLTDRENRRILDLLFDQIARPEFTVRFRWETDSLAFWDNRATAHLGPVDLASSDFDRRVERVTITGDLPIGPDGFESVPLRGELFS